jgi:integrase
MEGEIRTATESRARTKRRKARGVFEKIPGSGIWWTCYYDGTGRRRREKAGTWAAARDLYIKRKNEALRGKKLPETLRRKTVTFAEIAKDALAYSKQHKRDYRHDAGRMETLLAWFREYPAEAITAQDIERRFEQREWSPATCNRFRALLSLTYRLAIRSGKVKDNPARLVKHRLEDNARIRFLSPDEETILREAIEARCPEHLPEFELALHTGMRLSEQYGLTWANVSLVRRVLTIQRSKNGSAPRPAESVRDQRAPNAAGADGWDRIRLWGCGRAAPLV